MELKSVAAVMAVLYTEVLCRRAVSEADGCERLVLRSEQELAAEAWMAGEGA